MKQKRGIGAGWHVGLSLFMAIAVSGCAPKPTSVEAPLAVGQLTTQEMFESDVSAREYIANGNLRIAANDPKGARRVFVLALAQIEDKKSPEYIAATIGLAAASRDLGHLNQAETLLLEVIEAQPENAAARNNLAVVYADQKQYALAQSVLEIAIEIERAKAGTTSPETEADSEDILDDAETVDIAQNDKPDSDALIELQLNLDVVTFLMDEAASSKVNNKEDEPVVAVVTAVGGGRYMLNMADEDGQ